MSRSATPATRNEATTHWKPPKMTTSAELPIGTAIRSRTVADGCDHKRNVERTHPQPPDPQSETGTLATHSGKRAAKPKDSLRFKAQAWNHGLHERLCRRIELTDMLASRSCLQKEIGGQSVQCSAASKGTAKRSSPRWSTANLARTFVVRQNVIKRQYLSMVWIWTVSNYQLMKDSDVLQIFCLAHTWN